MKKAYQQSLWHWICIRVLALAIGSVIVIALSMWLRYALQNLWVLSQMPSAEREELALLSQLPDTDPTRLHQIIDKW